MPISRTSKRNENWFEKSGGGGSGSKIAVLKGALSRGFLRFGVKNVLKMK